MATPTKKQLAYAAQFGIDVPRGASRQDVSGLITRARVGSGKSGKRIRHEIMPCVAERRLAALRVIAELGIRVGCIVECSRSGGRSKVNGVVTVVDANHVFARGIERGSFESAIGYSGNDGSFIATVRVVHPGQEGYWHERQFTVGMSGSCVTFIRAQLVGKDRFSTPYGEFWKRSVVEEAVRMFDQKRRESRASRAAGRLAKLRSELERKQSVMRFCAACGKEYVRGTNEQCRRCDDCRISKQLAGKRRFCIDCGTEFDVTAEGAGRWHCPDCHR
ncbi:MAG: hypothetical protein ABIG71_04670 [Candidatus Uhrbacteria bacterium]